MCSAPEHIKTRHVLLCGASTVPGSPVQLRHIAAPGGLARDAALGRKEEHPPLPALGKEREEQRPPLFVPHTPPKEVIFGGIRLTYPHGSSCMGTEALEDQARWW